MTIVENPKLKAYIDTVCAQVKCKEVHEGIRCELEGHLLDLIAEYQVDQLSEEKAVDRAIIQMGDPVLLGKQLHNTHKPRMEWSLLSLVLFFSLIGFVTIYAIDMSKSAFVDDLFKRQVIWFIIGSVMFFAFYFFDYRKLQQFSKYLFIFMIFIMAIVKIIGININGTEYVNVLFFNIKISKLIILLMLLSLAGLFSNWNWQARYSWLKAIALLLVPVIFMLTSFSSKMSIVFYIAVFTVLIVVAKPPRKQLLIILSIIATGIGGVLLLILSNPYYKARLISFLDVEKYKDGATYQLWQSLDMVRSGGIWGNGFGVEKSGYLSAIESDFILSYIVYSFGWIVGTVIIASFIFFIIRLLRIFKSIRDRYGSMLVIGITIVLSLKSIWSILMVLGMLPTMDIALPFISYGGMNMITSMLLMGIIVGIYRRKDMINV